MLEDLGYFKIDHFRQRDEAGGLFISRLKHAVNLYILGDKKIETLDLRVVMKKMIPDYKVRWFIEVFFKVWKSIHKIDEVREMTVHRFMCLLYGKMAWIVVQHKIFSWVKTHFWNTYGIELSELKVFKMLQQLKGSLLKVLSENLVEDIRKFLDNLWACIGRNGKKQVRLKKKNQLFFSSS